MLTGSLWFYWGHVLWPEATDYSLLFMVDGLSEVASKG